MKFSLFLLALCAPAAVTAERSLRVNGPSDSDLDQFHRGLISKYTCLDSDAIVVSGDLSTTPKTGRYSGSSAAGSTASYTSATENNLMHFNNGMECTVKTYAAGTERTGTLTLSFRPNTVSGTTLDSTGTSGKLSETTYTCTATTAASSKANAVDCTTTTTGATAGIFKVDGEYTNGYIIFSAANGGAQGDHTISLICTCKIKALPMITKEETKDGECFSEKSEVLVKDVGQVKMSDLEVGQLVQTSAGNFEPLLGFAHKDTDVTREFLQIFFDEQETPLEVTSRHLLYKANSPYPVAANTLRVGDILSGPTAARINHISSVMRKGIFAPLTASGNIVVDGILASNYVELQRGSEFARFSNGLSLGISQHAGIHIFASPFRLMCKNGFTSICMPADANGMPSWVTVGISLARFADQQSTATQVFMLVVALAVFLPFYTVEVFGGSIFVALVFFALRLSRLSFSSKKVKTV